MTSPVRPSVGPSVRLVIDTDPGIDDVVTLALAARSPELDIVAVSTSFGNATLDNTTRNARAVLALCDRPDIPVYAGADRPLKRTLVTAPETHGPGGVGYAPVVTPTPGASPGRAARKPVLLSILSALPGPVTLVTLGPLTNLALALERDPDLVRARVKRHIGMFGTIHAAGNTNRWADFNSWADPEAADVVVRAELGTEMVGLDVTRGMVFSAREVERLARSADPLISWLGQALRFYVEFHRVQERLDGCVVNDVLTIGELLHPGLLQFSDMRVAVDSDDGDHRGHTRVTDAGHVVRVAMGLNVPAMRALLKRVFGGALDTLAPDLTYRGPTVGDTET